MILSIFHLYQKNTPQICLISHQFKIVENDPFLRLQMRAKEMFNRHQFFSHKQAIPKD